MDKASLPQGSARFQDGLRAIILPPALRVENAWNLSDNWEPKPIAGFAMEVSVDRDAGPTMLDAGSLPLLDLATLARRESHRPRPIYTAHKWFARRFGTAMRALLVASVTPANAQFWPQFLGDASLEDLTVVDLFIGGGTSLYEARRLGANVVGVDIDPVACLVTDFELNADSRPDPLSALDAVAEEMSLQRELYVTVLPTGESREALHYLWVQVVECTSCMTSFDVHPNYVIASAPTNKNWVLCAACGEVQLIAAGIDSHICSCGSTTSLQEGTLSRGVATCPDCGTQERLIEVARRVGVPQYRMFAIESIPEKRDARSVPFAQRWFHRPQIEDLELYVRASRELSALGQDVLPDRAIPREGRSDSRLTSYGYTTYADLFNDRQKLHLARLMAVIAELPEDHRPAFAMALSNHLTSNCMLTRYSAGYRQATPLFSLRAFAHSPRPVELNPWVRGTGRGTYPNALRKVRNAIRFAKAPTELSLEGFQKVAARTPGTIRVINGDSRSLPEIDSNSAHLVLTDPPYLDNIDYSELSDFFVPWLARMQQIKDPGGPSSKSLAAKKRAGDSVSQFRDGLSAAFLESSRILRTDGRMVFTFQHQSNAAWLSLGAALRATDLTVVNVFPMQGDSELSPHRHENSTTWDAVFVLRHRTPTESPQSSLALAGADHFERCVDNAQAWAKRLSLTSANRRNLERAIVAAGAIGYLADGSESELPLFDALEELSLRVIPAEVAVTA